MIMHTRRPLIHLSRSVGAYYEPHVRPWVHYVPATEENLTAAAEWLHTHPQRARAVADAAYQAPTPLNAVSTAATNATPFCCHQLRPARQPQRPPSPEGRFGAHAEAAVCPLPDRWRRRTSPAKRRCA